MHCTVNTALKYTNTHSMNLTHTHTHTHIMWGQSTNVVLFSCAHSKAVIIIGKASLIPFQFMARHIFTRWANIVKMLRSRGGNFQSFLCSIFFSRSCCRLLSSLLHNKEGGGELLLSLKNILHYFLSHSTAIL